MFDSKVFEVVDVANDQSFLFKDKREAFCCFYSLELDNQYYVVEGNINDFVYDDVEIQEPESVEEQKNKLNQVLKMKQKQIIEIQELLRSYE